MSTSSTFLTEELNSYISSLFAAEDPRLKELNLRAHQAGIPPISIAPEQINFLQLLLRAIGAHTVLEIGSLAGYSAMAMAMALPANGVLYAAEYEPKHAQFIRNTVDEYGFSNRIKVLEGAALDTVAELFAATDVMLDVVFIDADKPNYSAYLELVMPRVRVGGLVIGDNALAWGEVARSATTTFEPHNVQALDAFNHRMSSHPQLLSTLVPLGDGMVVGIKIA